MSLALLFHYLLLNIFLMLVHPSSGACDLLCRNLFQNCITVLLYMASGLSLPFGARIKLPVQSAKRQI